MNQNDQKLQKFILKGQQAVSWGKFDIAAAMFKQALEIDWTSLYARKSLLVSQIAAFKSAGRRESVWSRFLNFFKSAKVRKLSAAGKGEAAVQLTEDLLASNPFRRDYVELAVKAADVAKLHDVASAIIEVVYEAGTDDAALLELAGEFFIADKKYNKAGVTIDRILLQMDLKGVRYKIVERSIMPHKVGKKWKWGNIERDSKQELVKTVYGIWVKNGKKGSFSSFWKTGKTGKGTK